MVILSEDEQAEIINSGNHDKKRKTLRFPDIKLIFGIDINPRDIN